MDHGRYLAVWIQLPVLCSASRFATSEVTPVYYRGGTWLFLSTYTKRFDMLMNQQAVCRAELGAIQAVMA